MARFWKTVDFLNLFASAFLIILLIIVLVASLRFWTEHYTAAVVNDVMLRDRLYSVAVMIAIITTIAQWIEGRTISIIQSARNLIERSKKEVKVDGRRRRKEKDAKTYFGSEPVAKPSNHDGYG
jgi:hypothetical protein